MKESTSWNGKADGAVSKWTTDIKVCVCFWAVCYERKERLIWSLKSTRPKVAKSCKWKTWSLGQITNGLF